MLTAAVLLFAAPQYLSGRIVRQGMLNDPHILVEASDALRDAQYKPTLDASRGLIETPFASSWKGSSKPKVTLVEFYDYACPYCKASNPHVDQLVRENPDLRVVYRELPILGDNSVAAARLSLAASKAGRFQQFHDALYAAGRPAPRQILRPRARRRSIPSPSTTRQSRPNSGRTSRSPVNSVRREHLCSSLVTACSAAPSATTP
ncbi:thioredoxin domain-containing protein [Sphingomonas daechungensis]|uniref:Thioredoxin domain-containing protein n=1 Tax=Sphingomonas daechungensis TaxID=1176646 RepID=A0ABX6T0Q4_9SPHN|nr:thioredoxin domain-containing protein [Sphingomonas daechungensis]QNP43096.1 thioredoxin domain-containing protein [Sphingomonas daechungensis]